MYFINVINWGPLAPQFENHCSMVWYLSMDPHASTLLMLKLLYLPMQQHQKRNFSNDFH